MTRQEFKTADVLRLEVGVQPRVNLLTNPEFIGDLSAEWAANGGTFVTGVWGGYAEYRSTAAAPSGGHYLTAYVNDTLEGGRPYTWEADVQPMGMTGSLRLYMLFYASGGALLGQSPGTTYTGLASFIHHLKDSFVVPLGTATATLVLASTVPVPVGAGWNIDNPQLTQTTSGQAYTTLPNLIKNPSGVLGAWGWVTPPAGGISQLTGTVGGSFPGLLLSGPSAVNAPVWAQSEPEPARPGHWSAGQLRALSGVGASGKLRLQLLFYNSAGVQFDSWASGWWSNLAVNTVVTVACGVANPAGTVSVGLRVEFDTTVPVSRSFRWDRAMLRSGPSRLPESAISFTEPYPTWANILLPSHEIKTDRSALGLGTLSAVLRDTTLDPAVNDLIQPGSPIRLRADSCTDDYTLSYEPDPTQPWYQPLFTGRITKARTSYDLLHPNAAKRAMVTIAATDAADRLANYRCADSVSTFTTLPAALEGASTPWNINGTTGLTAAASAPTIVASNPNASVLDQVALTRDTRLGHAWIDKRGVLQARDANLMPSDLVTTMTEADYRHDIEIDFDTARCINEVTIKHLGFDPNDTTQTIETVVGPYRDEASIARWGAYSEEFTIVGGLPSVVAPPIAAAILAANGTPKVRCNAVRLPVTEPKDFLYYPGGGVDGTAVHLEIADRVKVVNARAGLSEVLRVTTIGHEITPEKWIVDVGFAAVNGVALPDKAPPLPNN
jgi:hypothetical protein